MKIIGLIAEYNPFHNGHLYHMQESVRRAHADAVIVVMSGDFVQRGEPALFSKRVRAQMALKAGADAVFEFPVHQATGSAETFARGAVSLLNALGCVDELWFGSECGAILNDCPDQMQAKMTAYLERGYTYPAAREAALAPFLSDPEKASLLSDPNNLLGIEYLRVLSRLHSPIRPATIRRTDEGYHTQILSGRLSSARALRTAMQEGASPAELSLQLPKETGAILAENWKRQGPVFADDLSLLLKYRLLSASVRELSAIQDVSPDLAHKILKHKNEFASFSQFCALLKSKELTYTRISRALLHIILDLPSAEATASKEANVAHYARLLGLRAEQTALFSRLGKMSRLPILSRPSQAKELSKAGQRLFLADVHASDLYQSILTETYGVPFTSELQKPILKL